MVPSKFYKTVFLIEHFWTNVSKISKDAFGKHLPDTKKKYIFNKKTLHCNTTPGQCFFRSIYLSMQI